MRNPLWILNSALIVLGVCAAITLLIVRSDLPSPSPITVREAPEPASRENMKVDITRIYNNDLFGTQIQQAGPAPLEKPTLPQLPQPPAPRPVVYTELPRPQFLPPLEIGLRGVIFTNDEQENRIIIADPKSGKEEIKKIGDKVLDADLIRIGKGKAIFLRSNGQEETLYISARQAQRDPVYPKILPWTKIIQRVGPTEFVIDLPGFSEHVRNLAQFIDMLDVTTAFDDGRVIGCRVGGFDNNALTTALGFEPGDIITKINGIDTTATKNRVRIYQEIRANGSTTPIVVEFMRQGSPIKISYITRTIIEDENHTEAAPVIASEKVALQTPSALQVAHAQQRIEERLNGHPSQKFMDHVEGLRQHDTVAMKQYGGRRGLIERIPS